MESTLSRFPLPLPASLESYHELFLRDPEEAVRRLEAQSKKRGNDAVCSLLLAWLYLRLDRRAAALEHARRARSFAPGSPFLEFVTYRIEHPDGLDVWLPEDPQVGSSPGFFSERALSLDELIERLSQGENARISIPDTASAAEAADLSVSPFSAGELATETLAGIYERQGKHEMALAVYERLMEADPAKASYYRQKMEAVRGGAAVLPPDEGV